MYLEYDYRYEPWNAPERCNHAETDLEKGTVHKIGDSVTRRVDVYDNKSRLMRGTVIRVYSVTGCQFGPYPELYDVAWTSPDAQQSGKGYFWYGIDKTEKES